ncbi:threonine ammonia-lyase IlvA [Cereibacter sphaeroides]|jgi:threonine dehydratase|uniref:threonine ammonia-lyase IlvA n=1 Tax=Cereibacter sphaeroides TaxID=1063 RepID=UPI000066410A|nr:threonine ammonia-lyase IlvA [Cereibacter sphaeroides]ABN77974.1 L-threonine ammonia-lyase [Cereibacter sphaeroides ATCC 17029]EKX58283.1 Threonine dehydratase [Rhodobacter sp. AKP1]AZB62373.1 threonine dehydratase [Cereibacter sphaeroides]AZB69679.1 threonine dehydratase [Cereibacter sphaeroides]MWP37307.1 threonine ammonia-lyase IlvA [Cereibacter sphaeroides]
MTQFARNARAATRALRDLFPETPLQRNDHLSARYGADIWLKREDLTPVRSYKLRGAFTAMRKVRDARPDQRSFVCASAGNHAQGVAYACRHFGVKGTIFMPVTTPQQKIAKTRTFGGEAVEIVLTGDYFDQTLAAAQAWCAEQKAHFLAPFDDPDVIEGQASVGVELLEQLGRAPDLVVLPVGGGGLASGVTAFLRSEAPETDFRFVEPAGGASLLAALEAGGPTALPRVNSFVDGAAVARLGQLPFSMLDWVRPDQVHLAPEDRICITMLEMLNVEGIVLEPAGALSVDVLPELADRIRGRTVVCVTSGGNFDFERLPEVKERAQRYSGLKKYFILRMPQRPGALREFLMMLGPDDDIARFEYLKKSARNFGSVLIGIETREAGNFARLTAVMEEAGLNYRDITGDDALAEFLV